MFTSNSRPMLFAIVSILAWLAFAHIERATALMMTISDEEHGLSGALLLHSARHDIPGLLLKLKLEDGALDFSVRLARRQGE